MDAPAAVGFDQLINRVGTAAAPTLVDVRRAPAFADAADMIAGARRGDPDQAASWADALPAAQPIVVYCEHGEAVSQTVAVALAAAGRGARYLAGGIADWRRRHGPLVAKHPHAAPEAAPSRWVTREHPKIDRIACPWLVRRFVDPAAEMLYVPAGDVLAVAERQGAVPYDIPGVAFGHVGPLCSFDAFIARFGIKDPVLDQLALIVRGADTGHPELTPQSPGLLAISQGLSATCPDDQVMLGHGLVLYDALYAWCRSRQAEAA